MKNSSYKYSVTATLIHDNDIIELPDRSITYLNINSDYDNNHMPTIYMGFEVHSDLYDFMAENYETTKIILSIKKYDSNTLNSLKNNYIQKEFSYIIVVDKDYHRSSIDKPLTELDTTRNISNEVYSYVPGTIALIDMDSYNDNKVLYNDIIKNSNMISIINKYTKHMPIVIEPFKDNKKIDTLIIPPITSINDLLKFLNEFSCFYDRGYRYFRDFDKTYILSNEGNPVNDGIDNYNTVLLNILDSDNPLTRSVGVNIDKAKNMYYIDLDINDTHTDEYIAKNKEYNSIIGISSTGDIRRLKLHGDIEDKDKYLMQRISNNNMKYIDNIKHEIDSSSVTLRIVRPEIDSSIITPNKEYLVQNNMEYQEYNGRYLLSTKKDSFILQGEDYVSFTILTFRKVMD